MFLSIFDMLIFIIQDSQSPACSYSTYSFEWEKSYGLEHILSTAAPIHDTAIQSGYIPPDLFEDYPLGRLPFVSANKEGYDPDQYPQQKVSFLVKRDRAKIID